MITLTLLIMMDVAVATNYLASNINFLRTDIEMQEDGTMTAEAEVVVPVALKQMGGRVGVIFGNEGNWYGDYIINFEIYTNGRLRLYWWNGKIDIVGKTDLRDGLKHIVRFERTRMYTKLFVDGRLEVKGGPGKDIPRRVMGTWVGNDWGHNALRGDILQLKVNNKMIISRIKLRSDIEPNDDKSMRVQARILIPIILRRQGIVGVIFGNFGNPANDKIITFQVDSDGKIHLMWDFGDKYHGIKVNLIGHTDLRDGRVHTVAFERTTEYIKLFQDGKEVASGDSGPDIGKGKLGYFVGCDWREGGMGFRGDIFSLKVNVFGEWGHWGSYSTCPPDAGIQKRSRSCVNTERSKDEKELVCLGQSEGTQSCYPGYCKDYAACSMPSNFLRHDIEMLENGTMTAEAEVVVPAALKGMGARPGLIFGNEGNWYGDKIINFEIYTNGRLRLYWWNGRIDIVGKTDLRDGLKHIVSFERTRAHTKLVVDGRLEAEGEPGKDIPRRIVGTWVGNDWDNSGYALRGDILQLKVNNKMIISRIKYRSDFEAREDKSLSADACILIPAILKTYHTEVGVILGNFGNPVNDKIITFRVDVEGKLNLMWDFGDKYQGIKVNLYVNKDLRDGKQHNVAFKRTTNYIKLYVDGKEEASGPPGPDIGKRKLGSFVGCDWRKEGMGFRGKIFSVNINNANNVCKPECKNGGKCASKTCECTSGYGGVDCTTPVCKTKCKNGGKCVSPNTCKCKSDYQGVDCSTPICKTECKNGGKCASPNTCECTSGYRGDACSSPICKPECKNGGKCVSPNTCECTSGYRGVDCSTPICKPECKNGGKCVSPNTCQCTSGYSGVDCSTHICNPKCTNGGKCVAPSTCECTSDYRGVDCSTPICNPECKNGGICFSPNTCECDGGYRGVDCSTLDGNWGDWSSYGTCSKTCGAGNQKRSRSCNNPAPSNGGSSCPGSSDQTKPCNVEECQCPGKGWCLNMAGQDQNSGAETIKANSKDACLGACRTHANAKGCEWSGATCVVHTDPISRGSGRAGYYCWVFSQCVGGGGAPKPKPKPKPKDTCPLMNVNYYGNNVRTVKKVASWRACHAICQRSSICHAWSYITQNKGKFKRLSRWCRLKGPNYKKQTLANIISGSKSCKA